MSLPAKMRPEGRTLMTARWALHVTEVVLAMQWPDVYGHTREITSRFEPMLPADWARGWIKVLTCADDYSSCGSPTTFDADAGSSVNLLQGPDGNIYQVTYDLFAPGAITRIAPVG